MNHHPPSKKFVRLVGGLLGILATYFIFKRLFTSWQALQVSLFSLHKGYLFLSFVFLLCGQAIHALLTYYSNTSTGHKVSLADAFRIWFLSQAGKYIPGGIWLFVSKAKLYKDYGISTSKASFLIFWETMALVSTALLISFPAVQRLLSSHLLSLVFLGGLLLTASVSISPFVWEKLIPIFPSAKKLANGLQQINRIQFVSKLFLAAFISWCFIGVSFYLLILSISPTVTLTETFPIFPLSWAFGFLTLVAPQGIGPREFALSLMLEPLIGAGGTLAVIVLSRMTWTLSDSLLIFIAFISKRKKSLRGEKLFNPF